MIRLAFSGIENAVEIREGSPAVLEIANQKLFSGVCASLKFGEASLGTERLTAWEDAKELNLKNTIMYIGDPMDLPWDDRSLTRAVLARIERSFLDDEELRTAVEQLYTTINSKLMLTGADLYAGYNFLVDWDLQKYLKAFDFGIDYESQTTLIDSLLEFVSLVMDARSKKVLVFVNLKNFLTTKDIAKLYEHCFFAETRLLLVENRLSGEPLIHERKYAIDHDFIEQYIAYTG